MGLSILIGVLCSVLLVVGIVLVFRGLEVGWGVGFTLIFLSAIILVCLIILTPIYYFEQLETKLELQNKVTNIEATRLLINDLDKQLYPQDGELIDSVNMNKLAKMIELKTEMKNSIVDLKNVIRRCNFKCEHKFLYIFPFDKDDFVSYEKYLLELSY